MLKPSLLNALRKGTALVISVDKTTIQLVPHERVRKPGGVFDYVPQTPRPPQDFYVEPVGSTLTGIAGTTGGQVSTEGAKAHQWSYNLTGAYDCQMEINDTWKNGDTTYRVISIQPDNGYEKVGVVTALGKDPAYGS